MWLAVVVSCIAGVVVGRGIVALTSAHRRGMPDRWWSPECDVCGGPLSVSLTRCRLERHRQPWTTPAIPIVTAVVFGVLSWSVGPLTVWPAYLVFGAAMVTLSVTDLETKLIPNRILLPATVLSVGLLFVGSAVGGTLGDAVRGLVGGLLYFGVMYALAVLSRGALGFGDVKLAFLIGVFTGYIGLGTVLVALLLAFISSAVVSLVLIATRRYTRKDMIPFGPFMAASGIVAVVYGASIISWYGT